MVGNPSHDVMRDLASLVFVLQIHNPSLIGRKRQKNSNLGKIEKWS